MTAHSQSAFVAAISQGAIRASLDALLGIADLLAGTALEPDQREYLEVLRDNARSLARVLDKPFEPAR